MADAQQTRSLPFPQNTLRAEEAWQRILARDAAGDEFIYGVTSTGVYCRPSCPSRRPARKNVRFFAHPAEAESAGFRACLRCRPLEESAAEREAGLVEKVSHYLRGHKDRAVSLDELGRLTGMSGFTVQRKFEKAMGVSPRRYQMELRAGTIRELLHESDGRPAPTVTDSLYEAGYSASSRLYSDAPKTLGMTPGRYRDGGAGETIIFVTSPCALGFILVAATLRGVCAVTLGDSPETLESELRKRFHRATIREQMEHHTPVESTRVNLRAALQNVLSRLTAQPVADSLPLDLKATAFQQRVWRALTSIPSGQTRTYGQLAAELGQPTAARAVARACASNDIALLIPCHRVVGGGGQLTGYRWGVERKKALLAAEQSSPKPSAL